MSLREGAELNIVNACWTKGYSLELEFSDGSRKSVDFEPFLSAAVQPDIRKYLDKDRFKGFTISYGNLVWNDYDLCFSIEDLYSGCLAAGQVQRAMVAEDLPEYETDGGSLK